MYQWDQTLQIELLNSCGIRLSFSYNDSMCIQIAFFTPEIKHKSFNSKSFWGLFVKYSFSCRKDTYLKQTSPLPYIPANHRIALKTWWAVVDTARSFSGSTKSIIVRSFCRLVEPQEICMSIPVFSSTIKGPRPKINSKIKIAKKMFFPAGIMGIWNQNPLLETSFFCSFSIHKHKISIGKRYLPPSKSNQIHPEVHRSQRPSPLGFLGRSWRKTMKPWVDFWEFMEMPDAIQDGCFLLKHVQRTPLTSEQL